MRDIKFRVWDKINKIMINSYEEASELEDKRGIKGEAYTSDEYYPWSDIKAPFLIDILDEQFELMQYTGLKDENGKEIYEGDIVKVHYIGGNGVENDKVIFYRGTFCVDYSEDYKPLLNEINHCCEVIGNIYDNKDLLEKEG